MCGSIEMIYAFPLNSFLLLKHMLMLICSTIHYWTEAIQEEIKQLVHTSLPSDFDEIPLQVVPPQLQLD